MALVFGDIGYAERAQMDRVNIVFFLIDDLGWMDLGVRAVHTVEHPTLTAGVCGDEVSVRKTALRNPGMSTWGMRAHPHYNREPAGAD